MIFWIFVILTVLPIVVIVATKILSDKYSFQKKNGKIIGLAYHNDESIFFASVIVAVISGMITVVMLTCIVISQVSADGTRARNDSVIRH